LLPEAFQVESKDDIHHLFQLADVDVFLIFLFSGLEVDYLGVVVDVGGSPQNELELIIAVLLSFFDGT
jgi:hypothetical protein